MYNECRETTILTEEAGDKEVSILNSLVCHEIYIFSKLGEWEHHLVTLLLLRWGNMTKATYWMKALFWFQNCKSPSSLRQGSVEVITRHGIRNSWELTFFLSQMFVLFISIVVERVRKVLFPASKNTPKQTVIFTMCEQTLFTLLSRHLNLRWCRQNASLWNTVHSSGQMDIPCGELTS